MQFCRSARNVFRPHLPWLLAALMAAAPAAAQYAGPFDDELSLDEAGQLRNNRISRGTIIALGSTNLLSIPLGVLPFPTISYSAEVAGLAADQGLKYTKAYLVAPPDVTELPNTADQCHYTLSLPQTTARYGNFLGLWPKFGNDRLFYPYDTPIDFGVLGVPEVRHKNTDVQVSVTGQSAGIGPLQGAGEVPQTFQVPPGEHELLWRADTLVYPVWDLYLPSVLLPVNASIEAKYGSVVKKLKASRSKLPELVGAVDDPALLVRMLKQLNRKIRLNQLLARAVPTLVDGGHQLTGEYLVEKIAEPTVTVSRARRQQLTVYDVIPPTIGTTAPTKTLEASDIGGTTYARHGVELRATITASDACGRAVTVFNDAPEVLPLGDTLVTWTVRDAGPALTGVDHNGDGVVDAEDGHLYGTVTQLITVQDNQAPILVPPPGLVIESNAAIDLDTQALGQPLVVDLADLHPDVSSSTNSIDGIVPPDTRTVVTWSAVDASANPSTAEQLVTVKTPGTNTAPVAVPKSAETLTSKTIDIVLTGIDADVLPYSDDPAGPAVPDPLQFRILQPPQNGEFEAPLTPFFIDDYRTDKVGGVVDYIDAQPEPARTQLMADYIEAVNTDDVDQFLEAEFCAADQPAPVDFVYNPMYVHVTDAGEQYFFDHYLVCDPNGTGQPPLALYPRISRWSAAGEFLGHVHIEDDGAGVPGEDAVFHIDAENYVYYVDPATGGEPIVSVQRCLATFSDTGIDPPHCQQQGFGPVDSNQTSPDGTWDPQNALVDIERELVYVVAGPTVNVFDYRHTDPGNDASPRHGNLRITALQDDQGSVGILDQDGCGPAGTRVFENAMEIDSAGNLYVTDNRCHRIHKFSASYFDAEGSFVRGEYVGWMGKCTGSNNLACDVDHQRTKGFSCTVASACTTGVTQNGSGIGQFFNPAFLAIDPNDILYVADYDNSRVQRFGVDGTFAGQATSTGNGINAATDGGFVLGNMGPPKHVSVNSKNFQVVDQSEHFVHVFDTSPFKDITDSSATVTYVSDFAFHSATDTFTYAVSDGLVDSAGAAVEVAVARNYRQPLPEAQEVTLREDHPVLVVLNGTDPDGILSRDFNGLDSLTFEVTEQPEHGTLAPGGDAGGQAPDPGESLWTYTPDRDYFGPDRFSFTVRDAYTDAAFDGATPIPEPYGAADPVDVTLDVASVNDSPIVRIEAPGTAAVGFPVLLSATFYDDAGSGHEATVGWGDGSSDGNGEVRIDDNGTPNDASDDNAEMHGVVYSEESLNNIGEARANVMHTYTTAGERIVQVCLRDAGLLETCSSVALDVEPLVALGVALDLSKAEVVDGLLFEASIDLGNGAPAGGAAGLPADSVMLRLEIPEELTVQSYTSDAGSCAFGAGVFSCDFGTLANDAMQHVNLVLHGKGTLLRDKALTLDAELTTASPSVTDTFLGSATVDLVAVDLDRDGDGLSNIFEAVYGVSDPDADDDGDGLGNLEESAAGTSPVLADTDGDGVSDADELNTYGSDPLNADTDDDGLSDGDELAIHGTDPASDDTDGDGLPDSWELDNDFDPVVQDGDGDADTDGLSDADEFANGSDYLDPDSDGDGLADGDEVHVYGTDPAAADTDGDGLDDAAEIAAGTLPGKPDTDDDGLADGIEVLIAGSDPLRRDTDRDGLPDGFEYMNSRIPLHADYRLAAGGLSSCALSDAGVECWGRNDFGQAPAVVAGLHDPQELTVGYVHACALDRLADDSRAIHCWGDNSFGQASVPALNDPLEVAAGGYFTCALDRQADDTLAVACWGRDNTGAVSGIPADIEQPLHIVASISGGAACVVDGTASGSALRCWGDPVIADSAPAAPGGDVRALALGSQHGCVVAGGERQCWGLDYDGQAPAAVTDSRAVELSLGGFHSCALETSGDGYAVDCWGSDANGQSDVPPTLAEPLNLASGSHHSCALDEGSAKCWGVENAFDNGQAPGARTLDIDPDGDTLPTAYEYAHGTNPLDPDTDRDGISDAAEVDLETDPTNADTDGDGVADGDELNVHGTDPLVTDTDGDGMPDDWEIDHDLLPLVDDAAADADGDGLSNGDEYGYETNPQRADTDDDGLDDGQETAYQPAGTLDPTDADTDDDGLYDGWELEHGYDPASAGDGEFDDDGDGLVTWQEFDAGTDPRFADTDGDGMPDGWEVDNGLDPTANDSDLDLDRDGLDNLGEYLQDGAAWADDVAPLLTLPADVLTDATGALTDVPLGTATAVDARDGVVTAVPSGAGPFVPGAHGITWSAQDLSGNRAEGEQSVGVIPIVNFGVDQVVDEGDTVSVDVLLNGAAVSYPVQVNYSVAGSATNPEDHDAANGSVMIESGTAGVIDIVIADDVIFEGEESFTLTMTDVVNAVAGMQSEQTITITQANVKPVADIVAVQQGRPTTIVTRDGGTVTITASVRDPNVGDSHSYDWSASDSGAFDAADSADAGYTIDPATLAAGFYRIVLDAADDGVPMATNRAFLLLRIDDSAPALDALADSDGDGVDDATEGYGDADGDRVPDYLDAYAAGNVLATGAGIMEAQAGHRLVLGETAFRVGAVAGIGEQEVAEDIEFGYPDSVLDFEVHDVAPGDTALVAIPLAHSLTGNAAYRKYAGGWHDFAEDADNALSSAAGSNGVCPAPGDAAYSDGLNAGDRCVQVRLQDGGPNDSDGQADGVIRDPGGIAVPVAVSLAIVDIADRGAAPGSDGNVIMALRLDSPSGDAELDGLTLRASGSGNDAGIRAVRLVVDENGNGAADAGESTIATGTFGADNGTLQLSMPAPYPLPAGSTRLLVTYDF